MVHSKESLIKFEDHIAELFNAKQIRAPIHLSYGNEDFLIDFFSKNVKEDDWVFSSWRSHYHCLLKGVPEDTLVQSIKDCKSISLCFSQYNVFSSAIVGGSIPIAVGAASALKMSGSKSHVYCFIGDMTSEAGISFESIKYADNNDLPITFVIENNGISVCTDTLKAWGSENLFIGDKWKPDNVVLMSYSNEKYPHAGSGTRVEF